MISVNTGRAGGVSRRKLLLIEDDASVVEALQLLLKQEHEVHSESTITAGLARFWTLLPALVVLDLRLPDGDGLEVLREIRSADPLTPVVVLTGYASMRTVQESLRLGASDYLEKPFDGFALKSLINHLLPSASQPIPECLPLQQWDSAAPKLKGESAAMCLHDIAGPMTTALTSSHYLREFIERTHPEDVDAIGMAALLSNAVGFFSGLFKQNDSLECLTPLPVSIILVSRVTSLALSLAEVKSSKRGISLRFESNDPEAKIRANRFALARVILNLIHNAIEAVEPGTGRVTLVAECSGGHVELKIRDNGPGIPPGLQKSVFEPQAKAEGSGSGLYISKRLVASMGGELTLSSKPTHGCCFSIKLPLVL